MDFRQIYETFLLRDILAHVAPGALALLAVGLGLTPELLINLSGWSWSAQLVVLTPLSYVAGLVLAYLATLLRLSASDHNWTWLADPYETKDYATRPTRSLTDICRCLAWLLQYPQGTPYEQVIIGYYRWMAMHERPTHLRNQLARQSLLKQICAHFALALAALLLASKWYAVGTNTSTILEPVLRETSGGCFQVILFILFILLLVAHLRHARFQELMCEHFGRRLDGKE